MSLSQKQQEFAQDVGELIRYCFAQGYRVTFGEAQRTVYQQKRYVETGRSTTMHSKHLKKLAVDLNFFIDGQYVGSWPTELQKDALQPVGDFWESLHPDNVWGGNWSSLVDVPHFQRS